jgi:hypothetical protein
MKTWLLAAVFLMACMVRPHARFSELVDAARAGDTTLIRQLVAKGADPNAPSGDNNWTPVLHAIHRHQTASLGALLDAGADAYRAGDNGVTPLMMAAGYGYDDAVQLLLTRGADPSRKGSKEGSALDWALLGTTDIDRFTYFSCQDSTVRLLRSAAPSLQPATGSRRWAKMKRCSSSS